MKCLLLGREGQVAWELRRALAPLGDLTALDRRSPGDDAVDFNAPARVVALIERLRPDVVVNAVAYTAVDQAESEPDVARQVNATTVGAIADAVRKMGGLLVHYSTDYVFDGSGQVPCDETAPPAPLSVYGRSKWEGEQLIQASGVRHLIFRTSWVYGARGGNFAKTMLRLAAERDQLRVIADQIGAPTGAELIADVSAHAIRAAMTDQKLCGLYHLVAQGETSWHAYAQHVIERARAKGQNVRVSPDAIHAIPTSAYPTAAQRPLNSRLDCGRLQRDFGLTLPHWQAGVDRMLDETLG